MAKVALLIGVGKYQSSEFQDLAAADRDVAAMRDVLVQPGIGGFAAADVTVLLNPEPQGMREALERLFRGRKSDDLVVLYFSGHGVVDDFGKFHLTTARTDKGLLNSTAIPSSFVHGLMEGHGSKRQVVILDCCFSGAFAKDMKAKGEAVNLQPQLGGKGRAVLTSSSATEYSFEQKEAALSVYTQYVVEGLRTGIADEDGDGWISVDELHGFAQAKVREVAPAMQPKIYAVEEGYKIVVAQAPIHDPKVEYRKEVERLAKERNGQFSPTILMALKEKQGRLGLTPEVASSIQSEVLRPYEEEFAARVRKYEQAVQQELQVESQLNKQTSDDLKYFQHTLGLTDEHVAINAPQNTVNLDNDNQVRSRPKIQPDKISKLAPKQRRDATRQASIVSAAKKSQPLNQIKWLVGASIFGILIVTGAVTIWQFSQPRSSSSLSSPANINESIAVTGKGNKKFAEKDFQGAILDYDQALKLRPENNDYVYMMRGVARFNLGDHKGAISDYEQRLKADPSDIYTYYNRGRARRALGDNQGAITDYSEAIRLSPDYSLAYNNRGAARISLGDNPGALADFDKAIQINKEWGDIGIWTAYSNRAIVRKTLGDKQNAIADYQKAAELFKQQGKTKEYEDALVQIKNLQ